MADMQYRELPHGGEKISVIGLGMGSIHEGSEMEIEKTLELALENGVIRHPEAGCTGSARERV